MMADFFPHFEIFRKQAGGRGQTSKQQSSAYPPLPHSHIFFGETKFVKSSPKENAENYPVDRWNGGGFHRCGKARYNDFIFRDLTALLIVHFKLSISVNCSIIVICFGITLNE